MANILIAGAGQLGSRYLQGLSQTVKAHSITVFDVDEKSLLTAQSRYQEVCGTGRPHYVTYTGDISSQKRDYDLVIASMSSYPRAEFVRDMNSLCKVRYWLLEKVLAPSIVELESIHSETLSADGAWVNHWMRLPIWFREIKERLARESTSITMSVSGGDWGLACNATHFMDLLSWIIDAGVTDVLTSALSHNWVASKRAGYFEAYGEILVLYGTRAELKMKCDISDKPLTISINCGLESVEVTFAPTGSVTVKKQGQKSEIFPLPYQSVMTAGLVDEILETGGCPLPTCAQAVEIHKPLIRALSQHWNSKRAELSVRVPIT